MFSLSYFLQQYEIFSFFSTTFISLFIIYLLAWYIYGENKASHDANSSSANLNLLHNFFRKGILVHPYKSYGSNSSNIYNFADLSSTVARLCTEKTFPKQEAKNHLKDLICHKENQAPKHIILILCDGLGSLLLSQHLPPDSFLNQHNSKEINLRAVFPSTTPAALTTFCTGVWPGEHGIPGWDLKDCSDCNFPGCSKNKEVQIRILDKYISDAKTGTSLLKEFGYKMNEIFLKDPWASKLHLDARKAAFINAYNGDEFQNWTQQNNAAKEKSNGSEFSSWQMGSSTSSITPITIKETEFMSIGTKQGSQDAVSYFRDGLNATFDFLSRNKYESTFCYLYTAHPDKHMHKLGTNHEEVYNCIMGINAQVEEFWKKVQDSSLLKSVSLILTADHGHVTVRPEHRIVLPDDVLECLEYANIGIHGKGRHAYLHCHAGLQSMFTRRWQCHEKLYKNFCLLSIEEAFREGLLFGRSSDENIEFTNLDSRIVRRMGDFIAISLGHETLVTRDEKEVFSCFDYQGAHGSLLRQEMEIPFVLCKKS